LTKSPIGSDKTLDSLTIRASKVDDYRVLNGGSNSEQSRTETSFISEKDEQKGIKPKTFRAIFPKQTKFSRGFSQHRKADQFRKRVHGIVVSRNGNQRIEFRNEGTTLKRKVNGKRIVNYPHFVVITTRGRKN